MFVDIVEKIVTNKRTLKLTRDEGWYTEAEMKSELSWTACLGDATSVRLWTEGSHTGCHQVLPGTR